MNVRTMTKRDVVIAEARAGGRCDVHGAPVKPKDYLNAEQYDASYPSPERAARSRPEGAQVSASDVGARLEQKILLDAAYARIKELMAEAAVAENRADAAARAFVEAIRVACAASGDAERALREAGLL